MLEFQCTFSYHGFGGECVLIGPHPEIAFGFRTFSYVVILTGSSIVLIASTVLMIFCWIYVGFKNLFGVTAHEMRLLVSAGRRYSSIALIYNSLQDIAKVMEAFWDWY